MLSSLFAAFQIAITQSISGTGALRIGTAFFARHYPGAKAIYLPTPTWGNHIPIAKDAGLEVKNYSYFDKKTVGLDWEGMKADIKVGRFSRSPFKPDLVTRSLTPAICIS